MRCSLPKVYGDIDEMVCRKEFNHVAKADFDSVEGDHVKESIRAIIYRGDLYVIPDNGLADVQSRGFATLSAINRALLAYPDRGQLPNCEFRIYVGDTAGHGNDSLWVYTKPVESETEVDAGLWLL